MRIAYFDCFSGISGDMCLGALIDAGAPFEHLREGLRGLGLDEGYTIKRGRVKRGRLSATKVEVSASRKEPHRTFSDISDIVGSSGLSEEIKKSTLRIFRTIFKVEAKVHGTRFKETHLHELSGTDCLIDITGTLLCLEYLDVDEVASSQINLGGGTVSSKHGLLPVPAPATAELIKGIPAYSSGISRELTTPTGAALITHLASSFGPMPEMTVERTGYGAGGYALREQPNILRVFIGEDNKETLKKGLRGYITEKLLTIETNIDDMNPQAFEYVTERLLGAGALDVYMTPVIMKKSRPATVLSVLCYPVDRERLAGIILRETTTLGVRFYETGRICLKRDVEVLTTEFGKVRFKRVQYRDIKRFVPEYEDCKRIANETGLPLLEVLRRLSR